MRSWIIISIVLYFIMAALSVFFYDVLHWGNYFWSVTFVFNILSLGYNFKIVKTKQEINFIAFTFIYRIFALTDFLIAKMTGNDKWMDQNIFFLCSVAFTGIIGMIINQYKSWKKSL